MLKKILAQDAYKKAQEGSAQLIDIRAASEFAQMSIEGSLLAPLPVIELQPLHNSTEKDIIFLCRSGKRTENASNKLQKLASNAYILDGGILAWQKAKLPIRMGKTSTISLERQIFTAAGSMVLIGVIGSFIWKPAIFLAGFVGAGLIFSGLSGFCGLGILLSKMPWNKN